MSAAIVRMVLKILSAQHRQDTPLLLSLCEGISRRNSKLKSSSIVTGLNGSQVLRKSSATQNAPIWKILLKKPR